MPSQLMYVKCKTGYKWQTKRMVVIVSVRHDGVQIQTALICYFSDLNKTSR